MSSFDTATALTAGISPGRRRAQVSPDYSVGGRTNGGYLLTLAAAAAVAQLADEGGAHPDPLAVSGTFTTSAPAGPTDVDAVVLRTGRGSSVVRVTVGVDDVTSLEALVTCGTLPPAGSPATHSSVPAPAMPAPQDCLTFTPDGPGYEVAMLGELREQADPATVGWASGRPGGSAELRAWVSFQDGRAWDPLALVLATDCLPPATFDLGYPGWVPTLQMSAFVRGIPAPGALLVRQVARVVSAGSGTGGRSATVDETCDVWDSTGTLVATGHQLAMLRL